ncbi:hypothetical protein BCR33DRAFT_854567 [Rhizoclosmatium globosum]|uniref:Uncharacterized protein n=1 Tax=Rhizoclosmatium globosum TaxID=329046 RepID=A0A1Y2BUM3_9FUNG|nr:hypothetical protein BCR33DRAFT_854567 [Rhizoclosmatium globosum]|eukprot:ORY37815.1 hypothetical protein BCR33DRAFT_854567 [Rhizoclosmatium globosum]
MSQLHESSAIELVPTTRNQERLSQAPIPGSDVPLAMESVITVNTNDQEGAPEYTEPSLAELSLITEVPLTPSSAPDYYSPLRPERLEDKIPNHLYVSRIQALNKALALSKSIEKNKYYAWSVYAVMFASIVVWPLIFVFVLKTYQLWIVTIGMIIFLFIIMPAPRRIKYAKIVKDTVAEWTKMDSEQGINIVYIVSLDRTFNANLYISCTIQFYEKLTFPGNGIVGVVQDLPTYAE